MAERTPPDGSGTGSGIGTGTGTGGGVARGTGGGSADGARPRWWRPAGPLSWRRGRVLAALAVLIAALLLLHRQVPQTPGRIGSLLESFLPWLGPPVLLLLALALLRRAPLALAALVLPAVAWAWVFGELLLPGTAPGPRELVVVQLNVSDDNADPEGTARALAAADPDLVALEELVPGSRAAYERALAPRLPYHVVHGTVGLWSRYPLSGDRQTDIRPESFGDDWNRGLRAVAATPRGEVAVHVAHLPSVRVTPRGLASARRDESAARLAREVAAEPVRRVILLGDLNGTVQDRGLDPLTALLNVPERGFALSFPRAFPLVRIDQVMARAATVPRIGTLRVPSGDHLPVLARVALD
ncbi:endonuclease/exonuclease/phosphatase family protein [Streptomyces sp. ACT015]|uniref:endonuclease/exonuclease/phosphatase family protein n=1 Tax=Streptomyces sp. ACT015 TaxID=3134807 RepID=UPI003D16FFF5